VVEGGAGAVGAGANGVAIEFGDVWQRLGR
jgi:hypothetical protein